MTLATPSYPAPIFLDGFESGTANTGTPSSPGWTLDLFPYCEQVCDWVIAYCAAPDEGDYCTEFLRLEDLTRQGGTCRDVEISVLPDLSATAFDICQDGG